MTFRPIQFMTTTINYMYIVRVQAYVSQSQFASYVGLKVGFHYPSSRPELTGVKNAPSSRADNSDAKTPNTPLRSMCHANRFASMVECSVSSR